MGSPHDREWVVGLTIQRGGFADNFGIVVRASDEGEAMRTARAREPGSRVRFVRPADEEG
jgi:hypothetical protein